MAKPLNNFEWATDTNYTTGPDVGTPTKVQPAPAEIDEGFVPETAAVPQHVNWALSEIAGWTEYLAGLETDSEFLGNPFHFTDTVEIDDGLTVNEQITVNGAGNYVRAGSLRSHKRLIPLTQFSSTGASIGFGGSFSYLGISMYDGLCSTCCMLDLPVGCTVTEVRVGVQSTTNGATAPIAMHLQRITVDTVAPTSANTQLSGADDVATPGGFDILTTGAVSSVIDTTSYLAVIVTGGTDAITGDRDRLLWCEVTYSGFFASEYE